MHSGLVQTRLPLTLRGVLETDGKANADAGLSDRRYVLPEGACRCALALQDRDQTFALANLCSVSAGRSPMLCGTKGCLARLEVILFGRFR